MRVATLPTPVSVYHLDKRMVDLRLKGLLVCTCLQWIHRDLACRNIYVDKELCCKLTDFGCSSDIKDRRQYEAKILVRKTVYSKKELLQKIP